MWRWAANVTCRHKNMENCSYANGSECVFPLASSKNREDVSPIQSGACGTPKIQHASQINLEVIRHISRRAFATHPASTRAIAKQKPPASYPGSDALTNTGQPSPSTIATATAPTNTQAVEKLLELVAPAGLCVARTMHSLGTVKGGMGHLVIAPRTAMQARRRRLDKIALDHVSAPIWR